MILSDLLQRQVVHFRSKSVWYTKPPQRTRHSTVLIGFDQTLYRLKLKWNHQYSFMWFQLYAFYGFYSNRKQIQHEKQLRPFLSGFHGGRTNDYAISHQNWPLRVPKSMKNTYYLQVLSFPALWLSFWFRNYECSSVVRCFTIMHSVCFNILWKKFILSPEDGFFMTWWNLFFAICWNRWLLTLS